MRTGGSLFGDIGFLRGLIDALPQPVFIKDDRHRFVALNQAMCDLMGRCHEELAGRKDEDFVPAHLADIYVERDRMVLETGEADENEEFFADGKGQQRIIVTRKRAFGVWISMDDFGTGYSSLSYLRSFPFDKIKIDLSFIRELAQSDDSRAIVQAISGLGTSLGITTTAEGVETPEQLRLLQANHCTEGQGYLFGKPCPLAQMQHLLAHPRWQGQIAA